VSRDILQDRSASFADEVQRTIRSALPGSVAIRSTSSPVDPLRYVVAPVDAKSRIPLTIGGEHLADLGVRFFLSMDAVSTWVKAVRTDFAITSVLDRTPLVRLDYRADMHSNPIAHWQVHAERGAMSHLLGRAHAIRPAMVARPHDLSSVHFPVGGERFRPCLEDFLQLAIEEMGFDAVDGWEAALADGRERWRRIQLRAMTRDAQVEVVAALRDLGWPIRDPSIDPGESVRTFRTW
jgi:hypothetical protein